MDKLPKEIILEILKLLSFDDYYNAIRVCKKIYEARTMSPINPCKSLVSMVKMTDHERYLTLKTVPAFTRVKDLMLYLSTIDENMIVSLRKNLERRHEISNRYPISFENSQILYPCIMFAYDGEYRHMKETIDDNHYYTNWKYPKKITKEEYSTLSEEEQQEIIIDEELRAKDIKVLALGIEAIMWG